MGWAASIIVFRASWRPGWKVVVRVRVGVGSEAVGW
jgi:hypothetical protein